MHETLETKGSRLTNTGLTKSVRWVEFDDVMSAAEGVRTGQVSAREPVQRSVDRITERTNPCLRSSMSTALARLRLRISSTRRAERAKNSDHSRVRRSA
jgi:hypothetical protein